MLQRSFGSLTLAVALLSLSLLTSVACSKKLESRAAELQESRLLLLLKVQENKERWAWNGDASKADRARAVIESILRPAAELSSRYDDWWESEGSKGPVGSDYFTLWAAARDPYFESEDARWLLADRGLEQVRAALHEAASFEGMPPGDLPLWPSSALSTTGLIALSIRRDLERGDHDEALMGVSALQSFGELWMAREGTHCSVTGFCMFQASFMGDELGRKRRDAAWTGADAERLEALLTRALTLLEPDLRPLRWEFWHVVGLEAQTAYSIAETAAAVDQGMEFMAREGEVVEAVEECLKRPLGEALAEAQRLLHAATSAQPEEWYWQAVHSYLYQLAATRSELETLQLGLRSSLTGEASTGRSSRGNEIQARVDGGFIEAEEIGVEGADPWTVHVPIVAQ